MGVFRGLRAEVSGEIRPSIEQRSVASNDRRSSVLTARSLGDLMSSIENDTDDGPFVSFNPDLSNDELATRRWLRLLFLASSVVARSELVWGILDWLDRPNEYLDGLSPFAATNDDAAFARVCALMLLAGPSKLRADSDEERRFREFRLLQEIVSDGAVDPGAPLSRVLAALQRHCGSAVYAQVLFACQTLPRAGDMTLFRLLDEGDPAAVERALDQHFPA